MWSCLFCTIKFCLSKFASESPLLVVLCWYLLSSLCVDTSTMSTMSFQLLLNYQRWRRESPEISSSLSPSSVLGLLNTSYHATLPTRDHTGSRVLVYRIGGCVSDLSKLLHWRGGGGGSRLFKHHNVKIPSFTEPAGGVDEAGGSLTGHWLAASPQASGTQRTGPSSKCSRSVWWHQRSSAGRRRLRDEASRLYLILTGGVWVTPCRSRRRSPGKSPPCSR